MTEWTIDNVKAGQPIKMEGTAGRHNYIIVTDYYKQDYFLLSLRSYKLSSRYTLMALIYLLNEWQAEKGE